MAYFLGRDIDIAITTEHATQGVVVKEHVGDNITAGVMDWLQASSVHNFQTTDASKVFAGPKAMSYDGGMTANRAFGSLTGRANSGGISAQTWDNQPNNLTALDVSLGVQDEDVAFIGQRNILKAEVKKENSLSLTRKKSDAMWDAIYNDARFGIKETNTVVVPTAETPLPGLFTGLSAPDFIGCGYRVVVAFNVPALTTTTLTTDVVAGDAGFTLGSTSGMEVGGYFEIDGELMKIVTITNATTLANTLRGQRDTTAAAHTASGNTVTYYGKSGVGEVLIFRNCYVTEHGVTLQVDGSQEETLTLMSYTDPKIFDGIEDGTWDDPTGVSEL
jgi:hypothetical protein